MIKTDIIIIGAGPAGLFSAFEAGLMKLKCHFIDSIPYPGGQLSEIYPKKPIYDIPGFPEIMAEDLVKNLMEQVSPFKPGFTLGDRVETISKHKNGVFTVKTKQGTIHKAPIVFIAGGLGCFEPRKPKVPNLEFFEDNGVYYFVREPNFFVNKRIFISGGGDTALDWAIYFAERTKTKVGLIHRSESFRAQKASVDKLYKLKEKGKIDLYAYSEVTNLEGEKSLTKITINNNNNNNQIIETLDCWLPLFGLSPKLGPISNWGLNIDKSSISVNNLDYQTNIAGIFAIGDINTYDGKLKLILCGFHEATLAVQSAYKILFPNKNVILKYTTIQGIQGF